MSIKNPYENYTNAYLRTAHDSFNRGVKAAVQYLEESCTEHPTKPDGINPVKWIGICLYKVHRKDCSQCWQELKESVK